MIRVTRLGSDPAGYYLAPVEAGVEPPGLWVGGGTRSLGLEGPVDGADLSAVLGARHPGSEQVLRRASPVRGFDLTAAVPKSVSVLWALAPPEVARQVELSRAEALNAAVGYLERHGLQSNRGTPGPGLVGAAFSHRTSRSGDPHLHTHLLVVNLVGEDPGRWVALDGKVLAAQARTAGVLYQAHLRHELSSRLEVGWGEVRHGVAQLDGVPKGLCDLFSARRAQVREAMARHGGTSSRSARIAALETRPERELELERSAERMAGSWHDRAAGAGYALPVVKTRETREPRGRERGPMAAPALDGLDVADLSSFSRRDLLEAICGTRPSGAPVAWVEEAADRILASGEARSLGPMVSRSRDLLRVSGRSVVIPTDRHRWVSTAAVEAERRLEESVGRQRGAGRARLDEAEVRGRWPQARADVAGSLRSLLTSGDGVQLLAAGPGPRRDEVLGWARDAWQAAGVRVVAYSVEEDRRPQLEAGTGLTTWSRDRLFGEFANLRSELPVPTVLVVGGAERLTAPELVKLAEACERTRSMLVLVGEPGRLAPEDRTGGWRAAERAAPSLRLERTRPGPDRAGRGVEGRSEPEPGGPPARLGALVLAVGPEELRETLVSDWRRHPPGRAVMVASTRADVEDLNARARARLRADGQLRGPEMMAGGLALQAGDRAVVVSVDRASRSLGLAVGQALEAHAGGLRVAGGPTVAAADLPAGVDLRHAYALTPYQARRYGFAERLVLGGPSPERAADPGGRSTYYLVGTREEGLRRLVELDPPAYLVATLGPVPPGAGRREWREAAVEVERYRSRWGIADPRRALGGPAGEGLQGVQRAELQRLVDAVRDRAERTRGPEPPSPALGRDRSMAPDRDRSMSPDRDRSVSSDRDRSMSPGL